MVDDKKDLTTRGTPAETKDDWKLIWSGVEKSHKHDTEWDVIKAGAQKAHDGWFVVEFPVFIFRNWKVVVTGAIGFMAAFGKQVLTAWGYL